VQVTVQRAFTNLSFNFPMLLLQAPGDSSLVYVMERAGVIRSFVNQADAGSSNVVLDIQSKIDTRSEGGLLGMAFHPQWATRKELFVSYTSTGTFRTVIARYKVTANNGASFDSAMEEKIFELDQPFMNHNGGYIAFGPDGYLYLGLGDGGSGDDPLNAGQRLDTNLGKFIRIDVNVPASQKYAIPPTNPYAGDAGTGPCNLSSTDNGGPTANPNRRCAEIYSTGWRNPWRWSFDLATGEIWAGDVGQGFLEEVDRVVLGGNYGWKIREGNACRGGGTNCQTAGFIEPVVVYPRSEGVSITGGFVYRGTRVPGLVGRFIFGDYQSRNLWYVGSTAAGQPQRVSLGQAPANIPSFGQTLDGEVYILGIDGRIYQFVAAAPQPPSTFPQTLSATGCFQTDVRRPQPQLVPYETRAQLWSDGASKERFFAIPDGQRITRLADGDFDFPNGTVTVKTFSVGGKRIETRLFMRHMNGQWAGYSYEWNDAETDATLLPANKSKRLANGQTWYFPSRAQCFTCHTSVAGSSLGLETLQLNWAYGYPTGRAANQIDTLSALGFFSGTTPPANTLPSLEAPFGTGPLEARARSYLHSNCSNCHRSGAGQGVSDLRYQLTLMQTNICNGNPVNGTFGLNMPRLVVPGEPTRSLLAHRIKVLSSERMPPLASSVVDTAGAALIDQWISSLNACP
jgi:uncharacterized repeat protein (TIGR03806 family)